MHFCWPKTEIVLETGEHVPAIAPAVISASRATDVPAFQAKWFFERLAAGYVHWRNPFNASQNIAISLERVRVIVFWSKYPANLLPYLPELQRKGIHYYLHWTLNDYQTEGWETGLPALEKRLELFETMYHHLTAEEHGDQERAAQRLIWRFDPLVLSPSIGPEALVAKVLSVGRKLRPWTRRLVFSFADIVRYAAVAKRMGHELREWTAAEMLVCAELLAEANQRDLGLVLATCAEELDLSKLGIAHNRCIDPALMLRLWPEDQELQAYFNGYSTPEYDLFPRKTSLLKDKGQRRACGCAPSKDIGRYNTCSFHCSYCYALKGNFLRKSHAR